MQPAPESRRMVNKRKRIKAVLFAIFNTKSIPLMTLKLVEFCQPMERTCLKDKFWQPLARFLV
jgi:hypothetical protein